MRPQLPVLLALPALILSCAFARAAGANGGGRGEDVAAQGAQVWTTVLDRVVGVNADGGNKVESVDTGSYGTQVAAGEGMVWQLQPWKLIAIDPGSRRVRMRIPLLHATYALAAWR